MKLTWYGHSAFLVEASDGTRIILDPYRSGSFGGAIAYAPVGDSADAVIASHTHDDHGAVDTVLGNPQVLIEPEQATVGAVQIAGVKVHHDTNQGTDRGENTIVILEDAGLRLVHLGDLGHELDAATKKAVGRADVLLIPVGGFFTIDAETAARVADSLSPKVVIPMHYKTPSCGFDIAPVDDFLATQQRVDRVGKSTVTLDTANLPAEMTTLLLEYSR